MKFMRQQRVFKKYKQKIKKNQTTKLFWTIFKKEVAEKSTFCKHKVFNAIISESFLKNKKNY